MIVLFWAWLTKNILKIQSNLSLMSPFGRFFQTKLALHTIRLVGFRLTGGHCLELLVNTGLTAHTSTKNAHHAEDDSVFVYVPEI